MLFRMPGRKICASLCQSRRTLSTIRELDRVSSLKALAVNEYALEAGQLDQIITPALAIYVDAVRHNIASVISKAGDASRWRPHVKTSKTTTVWKEMVEQKRQMIIQEIHSTAIDPKAKTPHPRTRIELALEESRFSVDPFKRLELQVKDAINILKPLIPLSFEPVRIAFRVSGSAYGQSSKFLRPYLDKEEWLSNGDWACIIQCPPGMAGNIIGKVKSADNNAEVKEL